MKKYLSIIIIALFALIPDLVFGQGSGHGAAAAYITTSSEPWGQSSNIDALNGVYGSTGWNKYIYGTDANGNVSNIFSSTRSLVFIEGGNTNTTAMKTFLDANWTTIESWMRGGRTLIVSAATNESLGKFQIGTSGVYSERILTFKMYAYSNSSTYPNTTSNVHPLLRTNVTISGVTGDAYYSGDYSGNYVAHNVITGTDIKPIFVVTGQTTQYTLAEKEYGSGRMLVGGLTLPFYITYPTAWQPQPQMKRFMYAMLGWVQAVSNPAPSISTTAYSNLGVNSVSTGGSSINANGETITAKGVAYSTSQNPTTSNSTVSGGSGTANFSVNLTSLSSNTTYYARAYATSPTGTGYGSQISFTTLPANPISATSSEGNTICSGTYTNLSVSNAQGTVYWYSDASRTNFVGTGNPRSVNPSATTTYYAFNYNGNFSTGYSSVAITVNQPASQPATASVVVPTNADGLTTANLNWGQSTGDGTITYYWSVGTTSTSSYESGYTARGQTTNPTITATGTGLTKSTGYYLSVKASNSCGTSAYKRSEIFRTNNERIYVAGSNGKVGSTSSGSDASITQYTAYMGDGTAIYAIPDAGYNFVNWSDGVTANPRTDLDATTSYTVTANFAPNRLAFVSQPTETRAGSTIGSFAVRYTDTYGNTMTNYNEPITISIQNNPSIGGAGELSGTKVVTPVNGVATFSGLSINKTGLDYTLKVSAASPVVTTPISSDFDIIPGAVVNYFTVEGITDPHEAGETTSPKVTAYDAYDNVKYDYTGTIHFSTNNSSVNVNKPTVLPANYTFTSTDQGIKTFTNGVSLKQYGGIYWVKVNDVAVTSAIGQQSDISVTSASLNYYTIKANSNYPTHNTDNNILAGTAFSVTAYLYDEFGNLKEDFTGNLDVTFTSNASPSPLGNTIVIPSAGIRTFTAGIATISGFTLFNAQETPTITIVETLTGSAGTTPAITVWPEALNNFLVQQPNQTHNIGGVRQTAGIPFSVMVTARDQYNNIKRDYIGRINFKSSNDNLVQFPSGLQQYQLSDAGIRTFTNAITINKADSYWLRVGDSPDAFKTGDLQNIVIAPGVQVDNTSELLFTNYTNTTTYPASVVAGDFIPVTIRPRDIGGNLLCDCQNVKVYLNGVDQHRNGGAVNGIPALVTIPVTDNHDGSYTALVRVSDMSQTNSITASVNSTTISTTLQVGITEPDIPSLIVSTITRSAGSITTDETSVITLQLKDQFGNNRTTNDGTIKFNTTEGGFGANNGTATNYVAAYAGNGVCTATLYASYNASTHGVGTATITAVADFASGLHTDGTFTPVVVPTVSITEGLPNLATSLITASDNNITTDETSTITVQLKDHLGNLIQADRGSLSLTATLGALTSVTNNTNGTYTATLSGTLGGGTNGTGISTIAGTFTGSGTAAAVTGAITDDENVTITEGLPHVDDIVISVVNATITADESTTVTVQLKDQFGNLIVNNRGIVTLSVSPIGVIDNGTNTGTTDIAAVYQSNGAYAATFKLNALGVGTATITGKFSGTVITDNATVSVTPGVATQLAMYTQPAHTTTQAIAGVAFSTQPKVSVQDQWGNIVTTDNLTEITAVRGSNGTADLFGTVTATATDGIATFSGLNYRKAEDMNIAFSVTTGLTGVTSTQTTVVHNVPSYMVITGTATQTAGVAQIITVRAYDTYGNIATRFDGGKSLIFSGAGVSPAPPYNPSVAGTAFGTATNLIFMDGVASASMVLYKEESAYVVASHTDASYSDSYTGATNLSIAAANPNGLSVTVSQAQAAYLAITGSATQVAGTSQTITVTAYDTYNNVATYYDGAKQIRFGGASVSNAPSTSPTVGTTVFGNNTELTFTNGVATASMSLYKTENAVVTATDYTSGSAGITTPNDNTVGQTTYVYKLPVAVSPAAASYLAVTGTGTQTAGASQTVTVTAYDPWNNVATGYTGSKNITFSGASLSPDTPKAAIAPTVDATNFGTATSMNFASGVATGAMILTKVETAHVKAGDGTLTTSDTYDLEVEVSHAADNYFAVTGAATQVAGVSQNITITMYDAYNNIATSYAGDKSLTFSGASASFYPNNPKIGSTAFGAATTVSFTNGVASNVSMTLYDAAHATQDALVNVTNGSQTATSLELAVNVTPNSATNLRLDTQPSAYVRAGDALAVQPVVSIRDAYGNVVTTDNATTITASRNSGTSGETLKGTVTKTAVSGVVTYNDLNYELMETITLDFVSSPVLTTVTSGNIVVDHNATAKYKFTTIPTFIYAGGQRGAYVVTRYDAYDNLVNNVVNSNGSDANSAETVYLYTSGLNTNPFITTFHNALTGGSTITSVNIANNATTASFWYYSTNEGNHTITGSDKATAPPDGNTNIDDAVTTLEVKPAALSHFIVSGIGIYNNATGYYESYYGDKQSITVEAIDIFGNRKINYTGTITFNVTDVEAVRGVDYPADYTFTAGDGADNGIHTFPASLILKPSYKHPDYPTVQEWWVSVVDMAQPSKYGSQTKIYVNRRPILVTAKPQSKIYGDVANLGQIEFIVTNNFAAVDPTYLEANPTPATYCNNEKVTATTFTSTAGVPATATVGSYDIVPSILTGSNGFDIANYAVSYANGALTVNKRPITITATANQDKVYGTGDPSFAYSITSATPYNALVNGDTFTGALARTTGENVATNYAINIGLLDIYNGQTDKSANYEITFVSNNFAITPWPLVLSNISVADKTYDGTDDATLTFSDNRPNAGDDIVFAKTADFSDKNVNWVNNAAVAKNVTYSVAISGGDQAGNYIFSSAVPNTSGLTTSWTGTAIATINQRVINVTALADSKVYDGNTSSDETPMVEALQTGDEVTNSGRQTFDTRHQGTGKTLTPAGVSISDDNFGNNYAITYVTSTSGEISKRLLAVSVSGDPEKVYDGDIAASLVAADYTISNVVDGESVSISETAGAYNSKNVGTTPEKTVTVALTDADYVAGNAGTALSNYTLPASATGVGTITARTLTLSSFVANNKMYDGTIAASGAAFSDNRVANDLLTFTFDAAFDDKHAANSKNVNFTNISISGGADQNNYVLAATTGTATANISQRTINVTAQTDTKVYDGNNTSTVLPVVGALQTDDAVTSAGIQTFDNQNYGTDKVLTPSGTVISDGNNGDNYAINYVTNSSGVITKRDLTVTVDANQKKTYGEANPAAYTYSITSGTLATGDEITGVLSRDAGENAGAYTVNKNTLSILETSSSSNMESNYNFAFVNTNKFVIEKRPVTLTALNQTKTYGNGPEWGNLHANYWTLGNTAFAVSSTGNGTGMVSGESIIGVGLTSSGETKLADTGTYSIAITPGNETGAGGFALSNYNVSYVPAILTVEKRTLHLSNFAADNKTYDGTTLATGLGFDDDRIAGDNLSFQRVALFDDAAVGTNKVVIYSSVIISGGTDKDNYALESSTSHWKTSANRVISAASVIIQVAASNKVYDGNANASVNLSGNFISGDDVSLTYANAQFSDALAANGKTVTVTGIALAGAKASQYSIASNTATATANITKKQLTVTGITAQNKAYDGTTLATLVGTPALQGGVNSDPIVLGGSATASFATASAGNGITVNVLGYSVSGTGVDNYTLVQPTLSANITSTNATITWSNPANISYGTLLSATQLNASANIPGTFVYSPAVGTLLSAGNHNLSVTFNPTDNVNYSQTTSTVSITVEKASLSVTANNVSKVYDGIPFSGGNGVVYSGFVNNENESVLSGSLTYSGTSQGATVKALYVITAGGLSSSNYNITFIDGILSIGKQLLTVTANNATKTYDGLGYTGGNGVVYSGFVNGEDETVLSGSLTYSGTSQNAIGAGNYTITPGGLTSSTYNIVFVNGTLTVNQKQIHVDNAVTQNKEYDRTNSAVISGAVLRASDIVNSDVLTLQNSTSGTFSQTGAGIGISVNTNMSLAGVAANNYSLVSPTGLSANILAKPITISGSFSVNNKIYDGTTTAEITDESLSLQGVITGDVVAINPIAQFINSTVGNGKTVNLTSSTLTGVNAGNYVLSFTDAPVTTAGIAQKELTVSGVFTALNKVYDASTNASINNVTLTLNGTIPGDDVALTAIAAFANKTVGNAKVVSLTNSTLAGTKAANYSLSFTGAPTSTADITKKTLTVSGSFVVADKVYNKTTTASVTTNSLTLVGVETGDVVNLSPVVAFADANKGDGKTVNMIGSSSLNGTDAANYSLLLIGAPTALANITAKPLTLTGTFTADNKVYDRTTQATISSNSLSLVGIETGDVVSLSAGALFADVNKGDLKVVNLTGSTLTGISAGNYTVSFTGAPTANANITAKGLTVSGAVAQDKTFDGTTVAVVSGATLQGVISGDVVSLENLTVGTFAQSALGNDVAVVTAMTLGGANAGNYTLIQPTGLKANILAIGQSITLSKGWNILSFNVLPVNSDLKTIFQTLINSGELIKIMNQSGSTIENIGSWINDIGNSVSTEGYKVKVSQNTILQVNGASVALPLTINLSEGWNLISYPAQNSQNAQAAVQSLINSGKLIKVMDEAGNTIENISGTWFNEIGNFIPGEGYKVKVNAACNLVIEEGPKSAFITKTKYPSTHFETVYTGNGFDHMNVYITNLANSGIRMGDEVAVYDGSLCVGAVQVNQDHIWTGIVGIPVSANDELTQSVNGYTKGHTLSLKLYANGEERMLQYKTTGTSTNLFDPGTSTFLIVVGNSVTGLIDKTAVEFKCYPNPFEDELTIELTQAAGNKVHAEVIDVMGRKIIDLYEGISTGYDLIKWNGTNGRGMKVAPGIYYVRCNGQVSKGIVKK